METGVDPLIGSRLDGRYDIVRLLAVGGMATVYEGVDTRLDRPVAVKVMQPALAADPSFVTRFRTEATSAARLAHPNVVAVHDQGGGTHGEPVHLVMELVRGRNLRELLDDRTRLPAAEALDIFEPIAAALAAAHAAGIVHRDIKPENVLLGDDGRVRVADFGLARAIDGGQVTAAAGLLIGTAAYLSPEQVGSGSSDTRSDVYASGVLLFEMLTGQVPFTGDSPLSVAYQHLNKDVPPPSTLRPGISPAVDELVRDTTSRDPEARLRDGAALLGRVRAARQTLGPTEGSRLTAVMPLPSRDTTVLERPAPPARVKKPPRKVQKPGRRRRRLILALVLLLACTGAGFGGWWAAEGRWTHAPRLIGSSQAQARAAARAAHLKVRFDAATYSDTVAKDAVANQDPLPGKRIPKDHTIVVHLSLGAQLFTVPTVAPGSPPSTAGSALRQANLGVGPQVQQYDPKIGVGLVITLDPAPGTQQRRGTVVRIITSKGPQPVPVADVRGYPQDQAVTALKGQGFTVTVKKTTDPEIPEGDVIDTLPAVGSQQIPGTTITLTVSTGKPLVAVPKLIGLDADTARTEIEAAGLVEEQESFFGNTVRLQYPDPGTMVKPGTTVRIVLSD